MKVSELMIGNWVLISPMDCDPVAKRVTAINYNSYRGKDYCDWIDVDGWDELSEKEIQPIPITAEILKKNGWIKDGHDEDAGDSYNYDNNKIWGWIDEGGMDIGFHGDNICMSIKYVHQLQHAMRLIGIEKEIVL